MMTQESKALPSGTQVEHYWIHETVYLEKDNICYRAEDMRLNRHVLLREYYPSDIAKRHIKDDGSYTVYVHPAQNNIFTATKEQFLSVYSALKGFQHTAITSFHASFEANGTVYTISDYLDTTTLEQKSVQKKQYSENEIGVFFKSLTGVLAALQYRSLAVQHIQSDTIHINKEGHAILSSLTAFVPIESTNIESTIFDIGLLMYTMLKGSITEANEKVEELIADDNYSITLCGLINRILSPERARRPKTLQEIQALLGDYYPEADPLKSNKSIEPETKTNHLSSMARLVSTVVIFSFGIYLLYYQPKELKIEEISILESMQYHLAAYFGSTEAQRALGQIYEKGVERNLPKALQWYKKAAKHGDLYSQLNLGHLYLNGSEVGKDDEKAANWYYEAAKQGSAVAQYNTGYLYYSGIGVIQDKSESLKWYKLAAKQGYNNASYLVGQIYYKGDGVEKDYKQALVWFQKSAVTGDINAQMAMGYLYERGYGVEADQKMAFQWYMKAAQRGHPKAQYNIANAYEYGHGTDVNLAHAMSWYKKVTEQNGFITSAEVTRVINKIHKQKHAQELKTIFAPSKKASSRSLAVPKIKRLASRREFFLPHKDDDEHYKLGYMYEGKKDYKNALKHYLTVAKQGDNRAQYIVGWLYEWHNGTKPDYAKAMYWHKKAAAQGNVYSYYQISKLYGGNHGGNRDVPHDLYLAFQWCEKAATNGLGIAQKILGYFYEFGKGTKVNYHKALYWYERGAAQGYKTNERSLAILKKKIAME